MFNDEYVDSVLRMRADTVARTVTYWDEEGVLIPSTTEAPNPRPYTVEENTAADAAAQDRADAEAARERADLADAVLDATAALMEDAHTDGAAWVQPVGAHDAYPLGAKVTHKGQTWTSTAAANIWEPGVYGWA